MSIKTLYPGAGAAPTIVYLTLVYISAVEPITTVAGGTAPAVEGARGVDTADHGVPEQEGGIR